MTQKKSKEELLLDFFIFSKKEIQCLDFDHFQPIFYEITKNENLERALWGSFLYMAYYNEAAAYLVFTDTKTLTIPKEKYLYLPIGKMRRNLRGGKIVHHISSFIEQVKHHGSIFKFITHGFTGNQEKDFQIAFENLHSIWGNGRWASFTTTELFQKINHINIIPKNIMNAGSTGPLFGLKTLMGANIERNINKLNNLTDQLFNKVAKHLDPKIYYLQNPNQFDHGMFESLLCNFNSLMKGDYYIGRDIDRGFGLIKKTREISKKLRIKTKRLRKIYRIRKKIFPANLLGENFNWEVEPKYAKQYYMKTGEILNHYEIRKNFFGNNIREFIK